MKLALGAALLQLPPAIDDRSSLPSGRVRGRERSLSGLRFFYSGYQRKFMLLALPCGFFISVHILFLVTRVSQFVTSFVVLISSAHLLRLWFLPSKESSGC